MPGQYLQDIVSTQRDPYTDSGEVGWIVYIEPGAGGDRLRLITLPGGHMSYSRDDSPTAFHNAARALYPQ